MADLTNSLIQIKRSQGAAAPSMLRPGELAYSTDESSGKKLGVLYVGGVATDENGYSIDTHIIGGKKYSTLLDGQAGVVTAGKAIVVGANGEVDQLAVGSLQGVVTNNATGEKTLVIGDGKTSTVIYDPYVAGAGENGTNKPLSDYVTQLVESGVELVAGAGIAAIAKNDDGAFVVGLAEIEGVEGTHGSATKIPSITVNKYGQITAVEEKTISTELTVDGNKVDLVSGKIVAADGVKSTQSATGEVTLSADDTVIRTTGGQTIAGSLNVTGQADFGVAPTVGEEVVLTDATVGDNLIYTSADATTIKVGGIEKDTVFEDGITVLELIDAMLHPYVAIKNPSLSITRTLNGANNTATVLEKGQEIVITAAKASWTEGTKKVSSIIIKNGSTQIGTGAPASKGANGAAASYTVTLSPSVAITSDTTISASITDGETTLTANASKISFVYPYYAGVVAAGTELTADVVSSLTKKVQAKTGTTEHTFNTNGVEAQIVFAYPYTGALTSVMDPNNFQNVDSFTKSTVSIVGLDGSSQSYSVWVANMNVDSFKLKFTHA